MSFAFKPDDGDWIEISPAGSFLPGFDGQVPGVTLSEAFVLSFPPEVRTERGLIEVAETEAPEGAVGWTIEDVEGVPTRIWQTVG